jgi:ribokinase
VTLSWLTAMVERELIRLAHISLLFGIISYRSSLVGESSMSPVIVFGSINMDIVTFCEQHPRIGETRLGTRVAFLPGGKGANQAIAAARCTGTSSLVGCLGQDSFGNEMLTTLNSCHVNTAHIKCLDNHTTGVANVIVDSAGNNSILVIPGANMAARAADARALIEQSVRPIGLAQLEVLLTEVTQFFNLIKEHGGTTILNPSPYQALPPELLSVTDLLIVNETELQDLLQMKISLDQLEQAPTQFETLRLPVPRCIVTLGASGVIILEQDNKPTRIFGHVVQAVDTTGAGDCFAGWLAGELTRGSDLRAAVKAANLAAAISVTRQGAGGSVPQRSEVEALSKALV